MKRQTKLWLSSMLVTCVVAGSVCYFFADSLAAALGLSRVEAATTKNPTSVATTNGNTGTQSPADSSINSGSNPSSNSNTNSGTNSGSNSSTNPNTNSSTNSGTTNSNQSTTTTPIETSSPNTPTLPIAENQALRETIAAREAYQASLKNTTGQQIASFSTSLAGDNASGRVKNIELAAKLISGTVLMPGDQFSFNQTTGDSNQPSAGWQLATVIVGDEFEQGYGGGICQVSSTLYNAVLQAHLQVVERYPHSLPVGYVPPGHDATVSYPQLDFKFANTLAVPLRIHLQVANGLVTAKLYKLPAQPQA